MELEFVIGAIGKGMIFKCYLNAYIDLRYQLSEKKLKIIFNFRWYLHKFYPKTPKRPNS